MRNKTPLAIILFGLLIFWVLYLRPQFLGGPASYIIVSGPSMSPTLESGDLAIMQMVDDYRAGDIITFQVSGGNVIHRIVGGSAQAGYITQGDNQRGVDPWRPTQEQVIGKLWLHLPNAGKWLINLRNPVSFAALAGLAYILVSKDPSGTKSRMKRGHRMKSKQSPSSAILANPSLLTTILGFVGILSFIFIALAIYSFMQPLEQSKNIETLSYTHNGGFRYTVFTSPSTIYVNNQVGPIGPETINPSDVEHNNKIFTQLAETILVEYSYSLGSPTPSDIQGELYFVLQIHGSEDWAQTFPLGEAIPFTGPEVAAEINLQFPQIENLITEIEEQSGYELRTYHLVVIPVITYIGKIGEQVVNERFAPPFTMEYNRNLISFDNELVLTETKTIEEELLVPKEIEFYELLIPVHTIRWLSLTGLLITLSLVTILAGMVFFGLGLNEASTYHARYGGMIINVNGTNFEGEKTINVNSMQDLVKIAQRTSSTILHQVLRSGSHVYFIPDGQVVYVYYVRLPQARKT